MTQNEWNKYLLATGRADDALAVQETKEDLLSIWQPNVTWFTFMGEAISRYNTKHNTSVSMSFVPSVEQDQ